jgi:hypothetical protein
MESNAPQNQDNTNEQTSNPKDRNSLVNSSSAVPSNPTPPEDHGQTSNNSEPSPWWKKLNVWNFIGEVLLIIIGVWVACIYSGQLTQMIESNQINRDSLISVQRAFVDTVGVAGKRFANQMPNGDRWVFETHFMNDGATPAIDVVQYFQTDELPNGMTEGRFVGDQTIVAKFKNDRGTIGSKQNHTIGPIFKTDKYIFGENLGIDFSHIGQLKPMIFSKEIYFWGWLLYRDVFPHTDIHLTEFCEHFSGMTVNPKEETLTVQFSYCGEHNCTDKYCKDYQQIVDAVYK